MNKFFRFLIIDDERDNLELIADEFKVNGHYVIAASSGNEAIKILKRDSFDVIISDFNMPNGNGIAVLNYVNTLNFRPTFYFVSGQVDLSVNECIMAGAKNFFSKPFDLGQLVSEVEAFLN